MDFTTGAAPAGVVGILFRLSTSSNNLLAYVSGSSLVLQDNVGGNLGTLGITRQNNTSYTLVVEDDGSRIQMRLGSACSL